jgi:hypothetical protein
LPTHAFLATTLDIFPPQACKKLTVNENNKQKNETIKLVVFTLIG